jgi:hypothetical protein
LLGSALAEFSVILLFFPVSRHWIIIGIVAAAVLVASGAVLLSRTEQKSTR